MITSTVTKRGQTTLPREIQNALQVEAGQKLVYEVRGDSILLKKHPGVMASFGSLKKGNGSSEADWKSIRATAREEWSNHAAKEGLGK